MEVSTVKFVFQSLGEIAQWNPIRVFDERFKTIGILFFLVCAQYRFQKEWLMCM